MVGSGGQGRLRHICQKSKLLFAWFGVKLISFHFVVSAKPQEFKARVEKRNEFKNEILGHSKQAEFIRLMEHKVENHDLKLESIHLATSNIKPEVRKFNTGRHF